ncbi:MAG: hypothetical protein LBU74_06275 [Methanobacteriaceae archaeon]|jgi:hypothetical protein|nr:hypothetical protein [Candidatus Methanorudis spinitermitis]
MNLSEEYGLDKQYDLDREKLLLNLIRSKYHNEEKRFLGLDNKSSNLIAFLGVMLTIQASIGSLILVNMKTLSYIEFIYIFFTLALLCYGVSIFCFIKSYNLKTFRSALDVNELIDEYGVNEFPQETIVIESADNFRNTINYNETVMNIKIDSIKKGFWFLKLGMVFTLIFIMILLVLTIGG